MMNCRPGKLEQEHVVLCRHLAQAQKRVDDLLVAKEEEIRRLNALVSQLAEDVRQGAQRNQLLEFKLQQLRSSSTLPA